MADTNGFRNFHETCQKMTFFGGWGGGMGGEAEMAWILALTMFQASLSESQDSMVQLLQSDISNIDLLNNVTRGLANFSRYPQNLQRLVCSKNLCIQYYTDIFSPEKKK